MRQIDTMNHFEHERGDAWEPPVRPKFPVPVTFDGEGSIKPPKEIIKRALPHGAGLLAFIAGQSQAGKTFVAILQAICIASGKPFFGFPVRRKEGEKLGVIYVAAEGETAIDRRFVVAKKHLGIDENLPIAIIKQRPNIADKKSREDLIKLMKSITDYMIESGQCTRVAVIYIDTVAAAVVMADENSNAEISVVCGHLREIGQALNCPIVPLIHHGKSDGAGIRGGSNWTGHGDLVLTVFCDRDKTGKAENRRIAISKHRDGEEGQISGFELKFIPLGKDDYDEYFGSCAIEACQADWSKPQAKKRPMSQSKMTFDDAFNEIAIDGTTARKLHGTGPLVQCVSLDAVETEFKRRYVCEKGTPQQQTATRKKQWQTAIKNATGSYAYAADVDKEGRQWVWKVHEDPFDGNGNERE